MYLEDDENGFGFNGVGLSAIWIGAYPIYTPTIKLWKHVEAALKKSNGQVLELVK